MAVALREGQVFRNQEVVVERPDGSRLTMLVNIDPIRNAEGEVVEAINVFHDITEQKQTAQLRAGLAAIVDSTDDAVIGLSLDGTINSWNNGAEVIFGYPSSEAIGRHITLLIPEDRHSEENDILAKIRRGERVQHFETVRRCENGKLIDISLSVSPIRDQQGRIVGASKIARDISERKRLEAQLLDASRRKDEFIATLAHELRNPLAPLMSGLQILRMPQAESLKTETLDRMQRQTAQLVHLIDDLLDVSRISTGKLVLQRKPISVRDLINTAIDTVLPNAKAKRQELSVVLPGEHFYLDADETRMCQLLSNLLNNAVKYSDYGQSIKLTAARQNNELMLTVEDNGVGIPSDYLQSIFEPFSQVPTSQSANGGLGIGLSLVKRLAELHGGSVHAHSDGPGRGSRFIVRLPVVVDSPAEVRRHGAHVQERPRRILVVDDNRDAADSLGTLLQLLGHKVEVQYDGKRALEAVKRAPPEVVLLDIGLPDMNGYEICTLIKQGSTAAPRVIALTGWGQEGDRKRASDAGFDAHLVKPVDVQTLVHALENTTSASQ